MATKARKSFFRGSRGDFWTVRRTDGACLVIQIGISQLDVRDLQYRLDDLAGSLSSGVRHILFDMSAVEKLRGPWGSHFAVLSALAMKLKKSVSIKVTGLRGHPLAIAWIFRQSQTMRRLIIEKPAETE